MTDIYREGNLIEITAEKELPAKYDGELLAFRLDVERYEFYYKFDGVPENTDDWHSLWASKYDANGDIVLHCMFEPIAKEAWKVDSVFTPDATQTMVINGVEVEIAQTKISLKSSIGITQSSLMMALCMMFVCARIIRNMCTKCLKIS